MTDLPPLREALEAHGLWANKGLGQHFLLDLNITRKIARLAGPLEGKAVIEVGPGPGGLTRALLEAGADPLVVIEKDRRFLPLLEELVTWSDGRLRIVSGDALVADEPSLLAGREAALVSNLPYNVGTALLVKWLKAPSPWRGAMTLMFQAEVARRIVARVGDDAYGRLAVLTQAVCRAQMVLSVPARAFTPPPKVESAVVRLDPLPTPFADLDALEKITAAAFGQRRKMLRSSLAPVGGERLCAAADIIPTARAEEIDLAGFLRLATAWRELR